MKNNSQTLNATYEGMQTPIERLRNKLTPYMVLTEKLTRQEDYDLAVFEKLGITNVLALCQQNLSDIHDHLADCEEFYSNDSLWEFCYTDCIAESSLMTISTHRTQRGAEMAMEFHKNEKKKEYDELYEYKAQFPFGIHEAWKVVEIKVQD